MCALYVYLEAYYEESAHVVTEAASRMVSSRRPRGTGGLIQSLAEGPRTGARRGRWGVPGQQ